MARHGGAHSFIATRSAETLHDEEACDTGPP